MITHMAGDDGTLILVFSVSTADADSAVAAVREKRGVGLAPVVFRPMTKISLSPMGQSTHSSLIFEVLDSLIDGTSISVEMFVASELDVEIVVRREDAKIAKQKIAQVIDSFDDGVLGIAP